MSKLLCALADPAATPEARVQAFIAEFVELHAASAQVRRDGDFDAWRARISRLDAAHFVAQGRSGLDAVMGDNPYHDTGTKVLIHSVRDGHEAAVETHAVESFLDRYFVYALREIEGDWRIARLRSYLDSAEAPFMTPLEQARFMRPRTHALRELPRCEAELDGAALFAEGRIAEIHGKSSRVDVRRLGTLTVSSGTLIVGDLGYGSSTLAPLDQRIAPGSYPIEISVAFGRVAALRMKVSEQAVVSWHPADAGEEGHVVSVDAGNVFVGDVEALLSATCRRKEQEFEKLATAIDPAAALMLHMTQPDDVAISTSGFGDGAYPVYWGVDAEGELAVLLVDMLVLTELADTDDAG